LCVLQWGGPDTGRVVEITITAKTTTDKPWVRCQALEYYGDAKCSTLNAPNTQCAQQHYHKPAWEVVKNGDPSDDDVVKVCTTCQRLGIEPSRGPERDPVYNHEGAPASG
jgi:hypothetical protein